ncbi:MAG: M1 family metallopeptidase [Bacteroidia bacterium]|nr:M1 family metallopeptidase [Bacteroidia bacterium]MCZ2278045.1 M1 family metallopeptidase [Bacteroidia bacterium]
MKPFSILLLVTLIWSCKPAQKTVTVNLPPVNVEKLQNQKIAEHPVYRASNDRLSDILHMELRVSFDWDKKYLYGESTLSIKPYFYPQNTLYLNARGMEIKEVSLIQGLKKQQLKFDYKNDSLIISLDKTYKNDETYKIFIDYVARPDELKNVGGSAAISSDKGLYFINADGSDPKKPKQIWTQGETQSNSVWFPTIDSPNERMTQELYITVDTSYVTLSNGLLVSSVINSKEGTRTDYWKQDLPHAPYLVMMAIGNYTVIRDKWRNISVDYFVEPEYAPYARAIFGNTPEMIEFFSTKVGVDFPWAKYAQVVVRDYVSGAMENTTATVHGEFLQTDARSLLDGNSESVISHELFHQWFGDLVTCESWSNVPLNEAFATYGEYLWDEYKYGRDYADYELNQSLQSYKNQPRAPLKDLIRFNYEDPEDMFDVVTYQKGARILHMLRNLVGDDAFFKSLKLYLTQNRFQPVEAHNLRLAFEEVTGKDLNWFFNQWFFNHGHPELIISYEWNEESQIQKVIVKQVQDTGKYILYRLPFTIEIYTAEGKMRYPVELNSLVGEFSFPCSSKPYLVNVDADKYLLCEKTDKKDNFEWIALYKHGPLYMDRLEALQKISKNIKAATPQAAALISALNDKFWQLRVLAIKSCGPLAQDGATRQQVKTILLNLAEKDEQANVRAAAINMLNKNYEYLELKSLLERSVHDSSYNVIETSIMAIGDKDSDHACLLASDFQTSANKYLRVIAFNILSMYGNDSNNNFMIQTYDDLSGFERYQGLLNYGKFLTRCKPLTIETGLPTIFEVAQKGRTWWIRLSAYQVLNELSKSCEKRAAENTSDTALDGKFTSLKEYIEKRTKEMQETETNKELRRMWGLD